MGEAWLPRALGALTIGALVLGVGPPLASLGIAWLAPPVRAFEAAAIERLTDGGLRLSGHLDKRWCTFRALGFTWRDAEGRRAWRVGYAAADQPRGEDRDRPKGSQPFGPWTVPPPPDPAAQRLVITARHDCGLVSVRSRLAEIAR